MVFLSASNIINALGLTTDEVFAAIEQGTCGIRHDHPFSKFTEAPLSMVNDERLQKEITSFSSASFTHFEIMALLSLRRSVAESGVDPGSKRVLFILSSTKGNIELLEAGKPAPPELSLPATAGKIAGYAGFTSEPIVVCNACISGILALIVAQRFIENGSYDHIFVTGADALTSFVVAGFESFRSMSPDACKPFDSERNGLSLGEGAATILVSSTPAINAVRLIRGASANDANHISGPSRSGEGLFLAIKNILPEIHQIDFISAHGTATPYNDDMESVALGRSRLLSIPVNSFKGFFGHTLGAAGIMETALTMESMQRGLLIRTLGLQTQGVKTPLNLLTENKKAEINCALKLGSGFGGCNAAILLEKN